ncbi:uncharacterized protein LOC124390853 isoform X2 [Silurus meridionalis]|uniref:uncharacterized protein LOC124390853 isoform X2 n=1 Tax=Silurus meridionalis TaxID=175797 RepID=UPI001EE9BE97|nr:uncharacterized protein LOC124390853 isoform X2 [Silurus meridionalis]
MHTQTPLVLSSGVSKDPGILGELLLTRKMDYLVSRNFLLLVTVGAIVSTRGQETLPKPVVPSMVNACTGSDATIECTFSTDNQSLKLNWYFGQTSNFHESTKIYLHSSHASNISNYHEGKEGNTSYLTIRNVNFNDSGWYFCMIIKDIPRLSTACSSGCQLVIYSPTPTPTYSEDNTTNYNTTTICEAPVYENTNNALKRKWKEDQSFQQCMPSNKHLNKQVDTLKPHKYESHPKEISIYENTKEASRRYGRRY